MGVLEERLTRTDDLVAGYMAHAQATAGDELLAWARERAAARPEQVPIGAREPPEAASAPKPGKDGRSLAERGKAAAGALARDVGGGLVEAPRQFVGGVNEAFVNAMRAVDPLAQEMQKLFPLPTYEAPTVEAPETGTGKAVREGAKFLTGFIPAFKILRLAGVGPWLASIVGGGAADAVVQDPAAEGIANLVQSVPALKNPVTEFLAADPEDPEALNRLRKAVEGLGFGALAEGIVRGVRLVAGARRAGVKVEDVTGQYAAEQVKYGTVGERDFLILGDPAEPLLTVTKGAEPAGLASARRTRKLRQAEKAVEGGPTAEEITAPLAGEPRVMVNFARIETADDVKSVIGQMTEAFAKDIDVARRGVMSQAETQKLADELGMSVGDLLARRKGQPFNAEEAVAARRLWAASAEKLLEAAEKAAGVNAGAIDQFHFRRMMAIHYAVQAEVIGARTETARALAAWRIPAGGGVEKAKAIAQLMDGMGGPEVSAEMARRLAFLKAQGTTPEAINAVVRRGWGATTMDMVRESYVLGLLWNPMTHAANTGSNLATALVQVYERGIAARLGGDVADGEALAMAYGLVTALKDAFRLAGRAVRTGESGMGIGKLDLPREAAIGRASIERELGRELSGITGNGLGAAIDFIGHATRIPGRLLQGEDELFKGLGFRMELHAQAVRQAAAEGRSGPDLYRRMAEIVNDPPENIRLAAVDAATYATFTNYPGAWVNKLLALRGGGALNPVFLVLPFIRTPANILRYAFERTPLAPLVGRWREDMAAGGARRQLALARMASGSAVMLVAADLAGAGAISGAGPKDAGQREARLRQGWQPFSVRVGERWYSYKRADPMGMMLGFAASMAEIAEAAESSPEDLDEWNEVMAAGIAAVSASVVNKSYFESVGQIVEAVQDPERYAPEYLARLVASAVPFSSALATAERGVDPTLREAHDPWQAIMERVAGLSERLVPRRDLWGAERKADAAHGALYDVISPVYVTAAKDSPIDAEMTRLEVGIPRLKWKVEWDGVAVNLRQWPEVYDAYARLAGNELKHPVWGLGAKEFLDRVVTGKHDMAQLYRIRSDGPEGGKAAFIKDTIGEYRELARRVIMEDPKFEAFRAAVEGRREERRRQRMLELQ